MIWRPSTIPAVKAAVFERLAALDFGADVDVCYGRPRDYRRESVVIGDTSEDSEQTWASLGDLQRAETYELDVICRVAHPGDSQREATERCFELFGVVELSLRELPTLGVAGVTHAHLVSPRLYEGVFDDEGYAALVQSGLAVVARI